MPESRPVVWLHEIAFDHMVREGIRAYPLETGGVLMGYWSATSRDVVVVAVIGPGPRARHYDSGFVPDADFHAVEVARAYTASCRLHTYLGDWHTHPDGIAHPSRKDRLTLQKIAACKESRISRPLMGILALGEKSEMQFWVYTPDQFMRGHRGKLQVLPIEMVSSV